MNATAVAGDDSVAVSGWVGVGEVEGVSTVDVDDVDVPVVVADEVTAAVESTALASAPVLADVDVLFDAASALPPPQPDNSASNGADPIPFSSRRRAITLSSSNSLEAGIIVSLFLGMNLINQHNRTRWCSACAVHKNREFALCRDHHRDCV
jgi:hypothetical protein